MAITEKIIIGRYYAKLLTQKVNCYKNQNNNVVNVNFNEKELLTFLPKRDNFSIMYNANVPHVIREYKFDSWLAL